MQLYIVRQRKSQLGIGEDYRFKDKMPEIKEDKKSFCLD